jgi:multicomponent K+:H+ antiporter subunit D
MNHLVIAPILIPALAAPLLLLLRRQPDLQRLLSLGATTLLLGAALLAYGQAADGAVRAYLLGAWPAPFGIVLVLDRLSALMVLLNATLAAIVIVYATSSRWDTRGHHFHVLFQFQLMGINGAFLTGDVFNLFVFFEVMLIASYGLLLHGGGPRRLAAGFQYVAINLVGSTLFLFAVGLIYAVTGTLNMADLAAKVGQVAPGDGALLRTGAALLFLVFALKAATAPLHWWLPTAYGAAPAPVAALFAIMTKVGAYAIIRIYTLVFGAEGGPAADIAGPWLLPASLIGLIIGALGVLASRMLVNLVSFSMIWSMGSLLLAVALFNSRGIAAALYYTLHSTLIAAALFLLAELIAKRRGPARDRLEPAPPITGSAVFGGLFFLAAIAMAGLPPLSGFTGKILILEALRPSPAWGWLWALLLTTSLIVIVGFARAGTTLFWKSEAMGVEAPPSLQHRSPSLPTAAAAALLAGTILLSLFAGPATRHLEATAAQILDTRSYVEAVLGPSRADPAARTERTP